jgi:hypothetical protein
MRSDISTTIIYTIRMVCVCVCVCVCGVEHTTTPWPLLLFHQPHNLVLYLSSSEIFFADTGVFRVHECNLLVGMYM